MSAPSTARSLPSLGASPLEQAAELVEDFVLQRSLAALDGLKAGPARAQGPQALDAAALDAAALDEALALATSLTEQSRLVDEEIARYLEVRQAD